MLAASNSNFLIPNWTFFADLIIFLIVVLVMARAILPPITRVLAERSEGIRRAIQAAEAARSDAEHATAERRRVLGEARERARGSVDEATRAADEEREDARRRGRAEAERMLTEARTVTDAERDRARSELSRDLGAIVVAAAERVIGSQVDPSRHADVIALAVASAGLGGGGGAGAAGGGGGTGADGR